MWLVAVNPTSGRGLGSKIAKEVSDYLTLNNKEYKLITGPNPKRLLENLERELDGAEALVSVGGDGLIHLLLQIAVKNDLPLIPIPAGTGNDFVRTLGWQMNDFHQILWAALNEKPSEMDLGVVDGEYFGCVLSTGFDSIVNERANKIKWPAGPQRYNLAIALELAKFKPNRYKFILDGEAFERDAMLIAIGNGSSYGGGMKVCPNASFTDGLFDVMILNPISKLEFLRVFPKVYSGEHVSHPEVEVFRVSEVSIESNAIAYSDGERIGPLPISAQVVPSALKTWLA